MSTVNEQVYASFMEDAKAFYGEVETRHHKGAVEVLRELDPPDPEADGLAIEQYVKSVGAKDPSAIREAAIRRWAEGRATLQKYIAKAAGSDPVIQVKDFFRDTGLISLFPAYIESRIQQGLLQTSLVNELIASDVAVSSTRVTCPYASDGASDRSMSSIGEGAELPETTITVADSTIELGKFGRTLKWTYEAMAEERVDIIGNMITKMGAQIGIDETDRLLHLAIAGDGTTFGAAETDSTDTDVAVAGAIAFSDLLTWYYSVPSSAYRLDKAVGGKTDLRLIADLVEFSDVEYIRGQDALRIPTPVAMNYYWWDGSVTGSSYLNRMVIGFDTRVAFQAYSYGGFISEADKIIERQINRRTFAYWRGFRKMDSYGVQVLDVNAVL